MKNSTRSLIGLILIAALVFLMTACGGDDQSTPLDDNEAVVVQTETDAQANQDDDNDATVETAMDVDVNINLDGDEESVDLPDGYPQNDFPIYKNSYVESVVSMNESFTIIAHAKDDPDQVIKFYQDIVKKGTVTVESTANDTYTVLGTLGKNNFQLTVAPEESLDNFKTTYAIFIMPIEE
ncbi:MAG: hypothetical protein PHC86_05595 [Eubacteriales bacterium]|nr:hypothetical protein [Eubacteriales bacterium]